jgi:hypothetical protein
LRFASCVRFCVYITHSVGTFCGREHLMWRCTRSITTYSIDKSAYGGGARVTRELIMLRASLSLSAFCCEFHVPFVAMLCVEDENRSYHMCTSSFGRGLFVKSPRAPFCNTSCGRKNRFLAVWRTRASQPTLYV